MGRGRKDTDKVTRHGAADEPTDADAADGRMNRLVK